MPLYADLVRRVFFPLSLWRRRETKQLRYMQEFDRTQSLPPDESEIIATPWNAR